MEYNVPGFYVFAEIWKVMIFQALLSSDIVMSAYTWWLEYWFCDVGAEGIFGVIVSERKVCKYLDYKGHILDKEMLDIMERGL